MLKSSHSLSLRKWFYKNARIPLFLSILAILGVESLLFALIVKHQKDLQQGVATRLGELSRLALLEGSTPLLQAGLEIANRELRATRAFVCERSSIWVLKTPQLSPCAIEPKLGYRVLKIPIDLAHQNTLKNGRQFEFVLQVPVLPQESLIYYTFGLSLTVCFLGLILLRRLGIRLERDLFNPLFKNLAGNFHLPIKELEGLRKKLEQLNQLRTQEAVASAVMARNFQVAHDIKSPLTALLFASKDFEALPTKSRQVIRSAVHRISAIADSLTDKNQLRESCPTRLGELIRELLLEKQTEYQGFEKLIWLQDTENLPEEVVCPLEKEELMRVLSNLINNAVESLGNGQGTVSVGAKKEGPLLEIWIQDTGGGFPPEVIKKAGFQSVTHGKVSGQGLGLSHAHRVVKSAGGKLKIKSGHREGSRVTLSFES